MCPCKIKTSKEDNNSRGFTLIEFVIYMAIGSVIFSFLVLSSLEVIYSGIKQEAISEVVYNAHMVFDSLEYSARNAETVSLPLLGVTGTSVILESSSNSPYPVRIYLENGTLYKTEDVGAPQALTTQRVQVGSFEVTNVSHLDGEDSFSVYFHLETVSESSLSEYQFNESFYSTFTLRK